jgi:iron complex outermembrane receptor protein
MNCAETFEPIPGSEYCLVKTWKTQWLPQYAISYRPVEHVMLYGDYSVSLALGPQAPFWTSDNPSAFLAPFFTRQAEVGAKYQPNERLLLTTAVFRMRAPFFYPNGQDFVSRGHETHDGAEFSAQGKVVPWLQLNASAAVISAISSNTGTPAFDGKQVLNQPRFRSTVTADLVLPRLLRGLALLPGWSYTGRKAATRDDLVAVPGYNLFNVGMRYTPEGKLKRVTFRLFAENITNKRYWKDTGADYGDTFLHVGAPTTLRLATAFNF